MSESPFVMDERNLSTIRSVAAVMYLINVLALAAILLHRQFVLHQSTREFTDLALLMVFNSIFFLGAVFFFGGFSFRRIRPLVLLFIYLGFVAVGISFTAVKYLVILEEPFSWAFVLEKSIITVIICAAFVLVYALFAYRGHRRTERKLDEQEAAG
ncbi:hypothetical protein ACFL41_01960 [Gemmatimonadota bacterium]